MKKQFILIVVMLFCGAVNAQKFEIQWLPVKEKQAFDNFIYLGQAGKEILMYQESGSGKSSTPVEAKFCKVQFFSIEPFSATRKLSISSFVNEQHIVKRIILHKNILHVFSTYEDSLYKHEYDISKNSKLDSRALCLLGQSNGYLDHFEIMPMTDSVSFWIMERYSESDEAKSYDQIIRKYANKKVEEVYRMNVKMPANMLGEFQHYYQDNKNGVYVATHKFTGKKAKRSLNVSYLDKSGKLKPITFEVKEADYHLRVIEDKLFVTVYKGAKDSYNDLTINRIDGSNASVATELTYVFEKKVEADVAEDWADLGLPKKKGIPDRYYLADFYVTNSGKKYIIFERFHNSGSEGETKNRGRLLCFEVEGNTLKYMYAIEKQQSDMPYYTVHEIPQPVLYYMNFSSQEDKGLYEVLLNDDEAKKEMSYSAEEEQIILYTDNMRHLGGNKFLLYCRDEEGNNLKLGLATRK